MGSRTTTYLIERLSLISGTTMLSSRIKIKVHSVKATKDIEGREGFQIDFVEVRARPPVVTMTPTDLPQEISQMVVQITKGVQHVLPGGDAREYQTRKLTLILTGEELESFNLKPYPNQLYELIIANGTMNFKEV